MERRSLLAISVGVLALAAACAQNPESPVSPSAATGSAAANADGSTLKVSAPEPVSPGEGERTETVRPTIVFRNSAGRFTSVALSYRVQVFDASGNVIAELGVAQDASGQTSLTADTDLAYDTEYRWRVRAEYQGQAGPWSALRTPRRPCARAPPLPGGAGAVRDFQLHLPAVRFAARADHVPYLAQPVHQRRRRGRTQ